jgi:hypothetical protein
VAEFLLSADRGVWSGAVMDESPTIDGIKEYTLDSWTDFFTLANSVFSTAPAFVYRGQANYHWPLRSSLDRLEERFPRRKNLTGTNPNFVDCPPLTNEEHINAFKRALRGRRDPNPPPLTEDDCWALGQHHGLATPLLDLTRSPFVALFFAFEEQVILVDGRMIAPEFRGVYALSTHTIQHPRNPTQESARLISPDSDANFRLISQAALFVKLPRHTDLEKLIRTHFAGESHSATFTKIKIPNIDRDDCLVALSKMNVNHMTLFPDIDGAARHVNSLWQPGHEDSIAYV